MKIIAIGKSQYSNYNNNWINGNSIPIVLDPSPNNTWSEWGAGQRDLFFLDIDGNYVTDFNITSWNYDLIYNSILDILPNDPPMAISEDYVLDEDTGISIYLSATDSDGDFISYTIIDNPDHGTYIQDDFDGSSVTYYPDANYNGYDNFTFIANDGQSDSNEATISLTINPINDAPYLDDIQDAVVDGEIFTTTLVAYDVDGDDLVYTATADYAYVSLDQNTLTIIPTDDFSGTIDVFVTVSDGVMSDTTQFTLTVLPYEEDLLGDVNGDGEINVVDIVLLVSTILGGDYNPLGDANEDGVLNVIDIVLVVGWILNP